MPMDGLRRLLRGGGFVEWVAIAAAIAALVLIGSNFSFSKDTQPTEIEARIAGVLSQVENAGKVRVLIGEGEDGGVLVVAEGADDLGVALRLRQAVVTLLGVENARVEVLKMYGRG